MFRRAIPHALHLSLSLLFASRFLSLTHPGNSLPRIVVVLAVAVSGTPVHAQAPIVGRLASDGVPSPPAVSISPRRAAAFGAAIIRKGTSRRVEFAARLRPSPLCAP